MSCCPGRLPMSSWATRPSRSGPVTARPCATRRRADAVTAVEVDRPMAERLDRLYGDRARVIHGDGAIPACPIRLQLGGLLHDAAPCADGRAARSAVRRGVSGADARWSVRRQRPPAVAAIPAHPSRRYLQPGPTGRFTHASVRLDSATSGSTWRVSGSVARTNPGPVSLRRSQLGAPARADAPGVWPKLRRNTSMNALADDQPHWCATVVTGVRSANRTSARCRRNWVRHCGNVMPRS